MQKCVEAMSKFVIARGEAAKLLEPIEEALNEVMCFVSLAVIRARGAAVATRRDYRLSPHGVDILDKRLAVVPLVGNHVVMDSTSAGP